MEYMKQASLTFWSTRGDRLLFMPRNYRDLFQKKCQETSGSFVTPYLKGKKDRFQIKKIIPTLIFFLHYGIILMELVHI